MPAHVLMAHAPDTSFPSDHAILAGAVTVCLSGVSRRLNAALVGIGLLMLVSRDLIGAHCPGDVVGGAVLGALVAAVVRRVSAHAGVGAVNAVLAQLHRVHLAAPARNP